MAREVMDCYNDTRGLIHSGMAHGGSLSVVTYTGAIAVVTPREMTDSYKDTRDDKLL